MPNTIDQQRAIDARGRHLLLSAAAGSGKTTTMVSRIAALLLEDEQVDQMLIITFTRAAAADMKAKLLSLLSDMATAHPEIENQLRKVESASIQTIDAFCGEVVRDHFEAAGADPLFQVADETQLKGMQQKALDAALEGAYAEGGADLDALHFGRGVDAVGELVMQLYQFAQHRPAPAAWLKEALIDMPQGDGRLWFDELYQATRRELRAAAQMANYAISICNSPAGPAPYADAIRQEIAQMEGILAAQDYAALASQLIGFQNVRAATIRANMNVDADKQDIVKKLRANYQKAIKDQKSMPGEAALLFDLRENAPALRALYDLALRYDRAIQVLRDKEGLLSFSDVAHCALRALNQPDIARSLQAKYAHIFVDEYQDVTDLQQALIDRIARGNNVFMVGDVKQSIYRFRQAEPGLFMDKQRQFADDATTGELIVLSQNFRSRSGILAFVNAVFERAMAMDGSELTYDDGARLYPGAQFDGDDPPVELLIAVTKPDEDDELESLIEAEREGAIIASRIRDIIHNQKRYDPKSKGYVDYRFRDIAIMTRNRTGMAMIERCLLEAGIPVYADVSGGYLGAIEVVVARSLLTLIENRRRDLPLLSVLHAPIGGLSSIALATVRAAHREGSYRDAMLHYMQHHDDEIARQLRALEDQLSIWRELSRALPVSMLIDMALRESGYYAHVGRGKNGANRQANLDLLISYASDYEAFSSAGLSGFLKYIDQIERRGDDMGAAHTLGEGDDVVQLMTIHKSKGLEYPVVIGACLGKSMLRSERVSDMLLHRDLGCGLALHDMALASRRKTLPQRAIAERARLEAINEELRIFYVLLTRAIDRLILVGAVKSIADAGDHWRIMAQHPGMQPKRYLDLIVPMLLDLPGGEALIEDGHCALHFDGTQLIAQIIKPDQNIEHSDIWGLEKSISAPSDQQMKAALSALSWRYPFEDSVLRPLKLSVSGLVRELAGPAAPSAVPRRPKFLIEDGMTGTERGTLTHQALMGIDLRMIRPLSGDPLRIELQQQIDTMVDDGRMMAHLDAKILQPFFAGRLVQRLLRAYEVHREWAFNVRLSMREALSEDADGHILVQGVIDCCFLEDGEWVLLDYKTDKSEDLEGLKDRYAPQLALYAMAVEKITKIKVKAKYLCLLRSGVELWVGDAP